MAIRVEKKGVQARWGVLLLGCAVSSASWAGGGSYVCSATQELTGLFTPRDAKIMLKTSSPEHVQKWTLLRTRDPGAARYKQAGKGEVVLVLARSQAELTLAKGESPLVCKLKIGEFTARPSGY